MLSVLYWNIKKKGDDLLGDIVRLSKGCDILIISELYESENKLKIKETSISKIISDISVGTGFDFKGQKEDSWLHVWAKAGVDITLIDVYDKLNKPKDLTDKVCGDSEYFADYLNRFERMQFYKVCTKAFSFLLVPIHFPSRIYATVNKQKDISVHFRRFIEKTENKNNLKSIVVGDFNMNPFESGMIHHEGFHALPTRQIGNVVEFYQDSYKTFYNPTWEKFGDYELDQNRIIERPAGSFFTKSSSDLDYYWYLFDQVILRHELISFFSFVDFEIVRSVHSLNDLLEENYTPNDSDYSDHLPVKFSVTD